MIGYTHIQIGKTSILCVHCPINKKKIHFIIGKIIN